MKKKIISTALLLFLFLLSGCCGPAADTLTQVSTIDALLAGDYEGSLSLGEFKGYGDFGIGTFDCLDGEMIMIDREVYQVRADGKVYRPGDGVTTPFASAVFFDADMNVGLEAGADFEEVKESLEEKLANKNLPCAVKICGSFKTVKTRSVPAQERPFPPLVEVTKNQPVFDLADVKGTIVGFRSPAWVKGVNVAGWHLHFLSADKTAGGHVLGFEIESGVAELDFCDKLFIVLPSEKGDFGSIDFSVDRSGELEKVEK